MGSQHGARHCRNMTTLPTTPALRTTLDGLRRTREPRHILAVFEPSNTTMKLGAMKSQLPWALEPADLVFCHTAGLDWDAADALARWA